MSIDPGAELTDSYRKFRALSREAMRSFEKGRFGAAAVQAQLAPGHAVFHHPGIWASPELERMLTAIGRETLSPAVAMARKPAGAAVERVLHVLTRVAPIGGHSRMAWRWINEDRGRSHSVVLTRQGARPVPPELEHAVRQRNGTLRILNRTRGTALTWAKQLRDLAVGFDIVVMHLFAEDVIPLIAFADRVTLPPIVFVDQADHAFSMGAALSDLYIGLRDSGIQLAVDRRGVAPERTALLPITLPPIERSTSRDAAKRRLGFAVDDVVLVSVARAQKYIPHKGEHYTGPFVELLDGDPTVRLVVVGPDIDDTWTRVERQTNGRIRAFPARPDTKIFYEAADIYVDSFPAVSNTSLLEAGSHSLPLVSRCPVPGPHTIFCADAPGISRVLIRAADRRQLVDELSGLVRDAPRRAALGEATRRAIRVAHTGVGWQSTLEQVYERALAVSPCTQVRSGSDCSTQDALDLHWSEVFGNDVTVDEIRSWFMTGLPIDLRVRTWLDISMRQRRFRPQLLLPEYTAGHLRELPTHLRRFSARLFD